MEKTTFSSPYLQSICPAEGKNPQLYVQELTLQEPFFIPNNGFWFRFFRGNISPFP